MELNEKKDKTGKNVNYIQMENSSVAKSSAFLNDDVVNDEEDEHQLLDSENGVDKRKNYGTLNRKKSFDSDENISSSSPSSSDLDDDDDDDDDDEIRHLKISLNNVNKKRRSSNHSSTEVTSSSTSSTCSSKCISSSSSDAVTLFVNGERNDEEEEVMEESLNDINGNLMDEMEMEKMEKMEENEEKKKELMKENVSIMGKDNLNSIEKNRKRNRLRKRLDRFDQFRRSDASCSSLISSASSVKTTKTTCDTDRSLDEIDRVINRLEDMKLKEKFKGIWNEEKKTDSILTSIDPEQDHLNESFVRELNETDCEMVRIESEVQHRELQRRRNKRNILQEFKDAHTDERKNDETLNKVTALMKRRKEKMKLNKFHEELKENESRSSSESSMEHRQSMVGNDDGDYSLSVASDYEDIYSISDEQHQFYSNLFQRLQPNKDGLVPFNIVNCVFQRSRLPDNELLLIRQMAEVENKEFLCLNEFISAMHLVVLRKNRYAIPAKFPQILRTTIDSHRIDEKMIIPNNTTIMKNGEEEEEERRKSMEQDDYSIENDGNVSSYNMCHYDTIPFIVSNQTSDEHHNKFWKDILQQSTTDYYDLHETNGNQSSSIIPASISYDSVNTTPVNMTNKKFSNSNESLIGIPSQFSCERPTTVCRPVPIVNSGDEKRIDNRCKLLSSNHYFSQELYQIRSTAFRLLPPKSTLTSKNLIDSKSDYHTTKPHYLPAITNFPSNYKRLKILEKQTNNGKCFDNEVKSTKGHRKSQSVDFCLLLNGEEKSKSLNSSLIQSSSTNPTNNNQKTPPIIPPRPNQTPHRARKQSINNQPTTFQINTSGSTPVIGSHSKPSRNDESDMLKMNEISVETENVVNGFDVHASRERLRKTLIDCQMLLLQKNDDVHHMETIEKVLKNATRVHRQQNENLRWFLKKQRQDLFQLQQQNLLLLQQNLTEK
ncbi:hypothetical protein SNEBB_006027 [Seison nebaliae]|nr:hypothetical protein SNEBB_006027 [Seison nebaliae]